MHVGPISGTLSGSVPDVSGGSFAHADERLHRSEALLDKVQRSARVGWWEWDIQHNTVAWSEELSQIYGVPPGTPMSYERFLDAVHAADRHAVDDAVLLNLLSNAVKFTPGGGRIELRVDHGDRHVHVRVGDTGRGIPRENLESIFDPFVQVEQSSEPGQASGVGLGLAISRELARGMGGDLTVESEPGQGSTFTLTLPRSNAR